MITRRTDGKPARGRMHSSWLFLVAVMIAVVCPILVAPGIASAALGGPPLITWNMQGATTENESKWTIDVRYFVRPQVRQPVVALQEVGAAAPARPVGTPQIFLGGNQLAQLPGNMINQLPPYNFQGGGPRQVRHTQWASGHIMHDVYFLQTDTNADSWGGGRVNLAMVTERGADEVVMVPNPMGQTTGWAARASLGMRLGNTWYFDVHALSRTGGPDAGALDMANIMSYDMHGAWETAGPTNFQAPLYDSMSSPAARSGLTVNDAINAYLMRGLPADKITMGVPLYGRGWTGIPDSGAHGLYQSVTGPTDAFPFSQQPGVAMYKELQAEGALANL